jgi:virginiamycin B lyase
VKTFTYDTPNAVLYGMRPAPDGSVWIAMLGTNVLGRVDTATGALKPYKLPNAGARPRRLQVASDGMVYSTTVRAADGPRAPVSLGGEAMPIG